MITASPDIWTALLIAMIILIAGVTVVFAAIRSAARNRRERRAVALTETCDPCHGVPGACQCASACGDPHCTAAEVGDDTLRMLSEASAEETERAIAALLADMERGDLA